MAKVVARRSASPNMAQAALDGLSSAVSALNHAVEALKDTVALLQTAIFGRWDAEANRQIPGMQSRLESLEVSHATMITRMDQRDRRDRWVLIVGGSALFVVVARALGVPTEELGRILVGLFAAGSVH